MAGEYLSQCSNPSTLHHLWGSSLLRVLHRPSTNLVHLSLIADEGSELALEGGNLLLELGRLGGLLLDLGGELLDHVGDQALDLGEDVCLRAGAEADLGGHTGGKLTQSHGVLLLGELAHEADGIVAGGAGLQEAVALAC